MIAEPAWCTPQMRSDGEHGAADDRGGTKNVVHDKPK
jgi:hypothetical protein